MSRAATIKDVLYGVEFGKQKLCRWPSPGNARVRAYSLEPGGVKVPAPVADKVLAMGVLRRDAECKYGEDRYVWRAA